MTQNVGNISFLVTARKSDAQGKLKYQWSSDLGSFSVGQGMDVGSVPPNKEDYDILTQILNIVQIEESELNSVLNSIMPIEGADEPDEPIVPDEPVIPPVEPDEPDEPDEPEQINYANVNFYLVGDVTATATYIDENGSQKSDELANSISIKVKRNTTIAISGSNIASCDSPIAPTDYPNRKSITFTIPEDQYNDIDITLDGSTGREYEAQIATHTVTFTIGSVRVNDGSIVIKVDGTMVKTISAKNTTGQMINKTETISVPNGSTLDITSIPNNATYEYAELGYGEQSISEPLKDFSDEKLDYTIESVTQDMDFYIVMQQQKTS
jgi:hypothetical protein